MWGDYVQDYKKLYAYLLGQIDDALVLMLESRYADAYRLLHNACLAAEDAAAEEICDRNPNEKESSRC